MLHYFTKYGMFCHIWHQAILKIYDFNFPCTLDSREEKQYLSGLYRENPKDDTAKTIMNFFRKLLLRLFELE